MGLYLLKLLQVTLEWTLVSLSVGIICEMQISKKKKKNGPRNKYDPDVIF